MYCIEKMLFSKYIALCLKSSRTNDLIKILHSTFETIKNFFPNAIVTQLF